MPKYLGPYYALGDGLRIIRKKVAQNPFLGCPMPMEYLDGQDKNLSATGTYTQKKKSSFFFSDF